MSSGLHCQAHPGEHYTNFCTAIQCLHPLCPECIDDHVVFHKSEKSHSEVASIINVKLGCDKKLQTGINILKEKLNDVQILVNPEQFYQMQVQKVQSYKQQLNERINVFCDQLLQKIRTHQRASKSVKKLIKFMQMVVGHITSVLEQFQDFRESFKTFHSFKKLEASQKSTQAIEIEDLALENLRIVCQLDVKSLIDRIKIDLKKECQDIQSLSFNENYLQQFDQSLVEIITLDSKYKPEDYKRIYEEYKSRSISPNKQIDDLEVSKSSSVMVKSNQFLRSNNFPQSAKQKPQSEYVSQQQSFMQMSPPKPQFESLKMDSHNFFINKTNRKILHFFKLNDKMLYEYDLSFNNYTFRQIQMSIPFLIPLFFSSVVTPQGDIYLLGGSVSQPAQKKPDIYCYEHINRQLIKCGKMVTARSSFSTCVVYPYIYSFGGLANDGMTRNTERFHILTSQSESLRDSLYAGISPAVTQGGKDIFKFGGNLLENGQQCHVIEKYSIQGNQWSELSITSRVNFKFHQFSAASYVNDHELIVFGGYDRENIGYQQTFLIKLDGGSDVTVEETWNLPQAEGFWSSQTIWNDNKLYALQNVEIDETHDVDETQRSILVLSARGWNKLN